ncbi:response regulator transcription factor [Candidatus Sulfurimonas marisnigri]|uniref:Response regulator transcription factor n=1 Tax=Candidatus Sulfurimonas marisnigri TaxID=2740405 RepID=A0A7S7M1E9_9BACT|nr:response regulator transcription factor [Candidatus Sulfurimonas marisnigri]QOY54798.1 response regulator transcription factor [Candidatus Sulfurimonas marisnigri]
MKAKILLLEDDLTLSETVVEFLQENDYEVITAYDGEEASELIYEQQFDLFLLDVNVPLLNGFELLKQKRDDGIKTPAIYITSLNSIDSLENGYKSGCDDYIRKPFVLKELLFRVESILKRGFFHESSSRVKIDVHVEYDTESNLLFVDSKHVGLNTKTSQLLKLFLQNQEEVISHERIYDALWSYGETPSENALRTYIKDLRKIIGKEKIVSIKKLGYRFSPQ